MHAQSTTLYSLKGYEKYRHKFEFKYDNPIMEYKI